MHKVKGKKRTKKSTDYIAEEKRESTIFSLRWNQETIYYAGG